MADYQSSYTGAQVDAATAFGHDPDTEPHLNSQAGVTSDGIYQADRALEAKIVNRNLLHNPYFRIDQRQGFIVPPNKNYYSDTALTTLVGQTSEYTTVTAKASGYNTINIGGTNYYVAVADCVRGYVAIGGSTTRINDRWAIWIADGGNGGVVILNNDDGTFTVKRISGTHSTVADSFSVFYRMSAEETKALRAQTVTISSKTDLGDLIFQHDVPSSGTTDSGFKFYPNSSPWALQFTIDNQNQGVIAISGYYVPLNSEKTFSANKLEFGSISTLEAEMDSGAYNQDLDLWECYDYLQPIPQYTIWDAYLWSGGRVDGYYNLIKPMRGATPTVTGTVNYGVGNSITYNKTITQTQFMKVNGKNTNVIQLSVADSALTDQFGSMRANSDIWVSTEL